MPFPFLGSETRVYPAYLDLDAGGTLVASPGGSYDMQPAGGLNLPVPPADELWPQPDDGEDDPPPPPAGVPPIALIGAPPKDDGGQDGQPGTDPAESTEE